jgi:hypothetical protein
MCDALSSSGFVQASKTRDGVEEMCLFNCRLRLRDTESALSMGVSCLVAGTGWLGG